LTLVTSTYLAGLTHPSTMMRCESSCAIIFCIIGCAASADLLAPGAGLMRKDQEGAVTEHSTEKSTISVTTNGHLVDEHHVGLHSAPVREHNAKAKLCDSSCTLNVKVFTNTTGEGSSIAATYKTLQMKGCKDEEFHFDGCDISCAAATICTNSERKPTGVRLLKNSGGDIVGYGSCCVPGQTDTVVSTTMDSCEAPKTNLVPTVEMIGTKAQATPVTAPVAPTTAPQKAVPAPPVPAAATAAPAPDPTSIEQAVTLLPPMVIGCVSIGGLAIVTSSMLMYSHFKAGARITGSFHTLHSSSATFIGLLWTVPVFTALGLYGVLLPEMAAAWQFLQALLLTATLRRMPAMFLQVGGGRLQMQRSLQVNGEGEPVHAFSQFPLLFLRRFVPSKIPQISDIDDLQLAVTFACTLLPVLSFLEMLCTLEATLPATLTHRTIALSAPGVAFFIRLMEVLLIVLSMSALRGLDLIVHTVSPKASEELNLKGKSEYCQCFLGGLRLLPILVNLLVFAWNRGALPDNRRADAFRSFLVCVASLGCVWMSKLAFPVDEYHYPELKAAAGLEDATSQKKMKTKAVLDTVVFCPFCGSGDLELEPGSTDAASCPTCCARQVPINLIVHRDRVSAAPSSAAASSGMQDKEAVSS